MLNYSVNQMNHPIRIGCQLLIVGNDYKCLIKFLSQFEKQLMQFLLLGNNNDGEV